MRAHTIEHDKWEGSTSHPLRFCSSCTLYTWLSWLRSDMLGLTWAGSVAGVVWRCVQGVRLRTKTQAIHGHSGTWCPFFQTKVWANTEAIQGHSGKLYPLFPKQNVSEDPRSPRSFWKMMSFFSHTKVWAKTQAIHGSGLVIRCVSKWRSSGFANFKISCIKQ